MFPLIWTKARMPNGHHISVVKTGTWRSLNAAFTDNTFLFSCHCVRHLNNKFIVQVHCLTECRPINNVQMMHDALFLWIYGHMTCTRLAALICEVFNSTATFALFFVAAEGLPHPLSGAGAREPESCAGNQKQTAPPAGKEDDWDWPAGKTWGRWKWLLGIKTSNATDLKQKHMNHLTIQIFFFPEREKCEVGWKP